MTRGIRFYYNNFGAATASTLTASSELSGFEVEYAFDSFRFTGWRQTGAFEVTSTNKTLYINDGSNKTVTLTEATYATGALLAAHIQTQLNASSTNWTCTYSTTTYKFTIGRSSGTATLRLTQTTNAAWDMLGYIGVVDDDVGTGQAADSVRIHTSEFIVFDLGSAREFTAFHVIGPADEPFSISETATATLKANSINSFTSAPYSESLTITDDGIFFIVDDTDNTTYRYVRFDFIDRENPNGPQSFDLRCIYLGDHVEMTDRNVVNGFTAELVDPSIKSFSSSGVPYFRTLPKYWMITGVGIDWNKTTDRIKIIDLFRDVGNTVPFFVSIDPTGEISDGIKELTKFVVIDGSLVNQHQRYNYFSQQLTFREVIG